MSSNVNVIVSEYLKRSCHCIVSELSSIRVTFCNWFFSLVYGVGKTRGKRNYMEDVDFALEAIRVKDKATAAAYGSF